MRAVIIGNGDIVDYERIRSFLRPEDFIICADGGMRHAMRMGLTPEVLLGDFDSVSPGEKAAAKVIEYPARKDFTDGELCVDYAVKNGFSEILLLGMTGTRLDHTINNILLLFRCPNGCLIDEHNEIYAISDRLRIQNRRGKTLSILPVYGNLEGITTTGLEYALNRETLFFGTTRGNSNVIVADDAEICVENGKGIVIIGNGE